MHRRVYRHGGIVTAIQTRIPGTVDSPARLRDRIRTARAALRRNAENIERAKEDARALRAAAAEAEQVREDGEARVLVDLASPEDVREFRRGYEAARDARKGLLDALTTLKSYRRAEVAYRKQLDVATEELVIQLETGPVKR